LFSLVKIFSSLLALLSRFVWSFLSSLRSTKCWCPQIFQLVFKFGHSLDCCHAILLLVGGDGNYHR
jgi:hypothetical protein